MGAVLHFKQCNVKSAFGHSHGGHGHSHGGHGHGHSHGGHGHGHSHGGHSHGGHGHGHSHGDSSHEHPRSLAAVNSILVVNESGSNSCSVLSLDTVSDDDRLILADDFNDPSSRVPSVHVAREAKTNINVRAAFVHVVGDLIQSIGVLVAAVVIHIWVNIETTTACKLMVSIE
jgi:zinc transporter 2